MIEQIRQTLEELFQTNLNIDLANEFQRNLLLSVLIILLDIGENRTFNKKINAL